MRPGDLTHVAWQEWPAVSKINWCYSLPFTSLLVLDTYNANKKM
jgi:hypothetical protein